MNECVHARLVLQPSHVVVGCVQQHAHYHVELHELQLQGRTVVVVMLCY